MLSHPNIAQHSLHCMRFAGVTLQMPSKVEVISVHMSLKNGQRGRRGSCRISLNVLCMVTLGSPLDEFRLFKLKKKCDSHEKRGHRYNVPYRHAGNI